MANTSKKFTRTTDIEKALKNLKRNDLVAIVFKPISDKVMASPAWQAAIRA